MTARLILIIDDDPSILYIAELGLRRSTGWTVVTANSGQAGLAIAEVEQPDAILLDMMMPGMDGLSTLKQAKSNPKTKDIPVIFLTAKAQPADRSQFCAAGAEGLIPKPFNPNTLAAQVEEFLSNV